jgi:hypothetical protein
MVELMNETKDPRPAVVTITYEYIPYMPHNFEKVTPIWLSIAGCDITSEMPVPNNTAVFEYTSPPWKANFTGRITLAGSHLHDGGVNLELLKVDKVICDAAAVYGQTPGYVENMSDSMSMINGTYGVDMVHISSIKTCQNVGLMEEGETWTVKANYNLTAHPPMVDMDGTLEPIMGISIFYATQGYGDVPQGC